MHYLTDINSINENVIKYFLPVILNIQATKLQNIFIQHEYFLHKICIAFVFEYYIHVFIDDILMIYSLYIKMLLDSKQRSLMHFFRPIKSKNFVH